MTQAKDRRQWPVHLIKILVLLCIAVLSVFIGVKDVSIQDIFSLSAEQLEVMVLSRIPRLASILLTGASLSIAGLIMQTITQNRFMSADTAGTSEWCRFGVMLTILFFPGAPTIVRVIVAFAVALVGTLFFMFVMSRIKYTNNILMPLIGMMLGSVVSAISTFFAYQYDIVQNMSSWLQGNFSLIIKGHYELLYLGIPLLLLAYFFANHFTIAGMGKDMTTSLGLNHQHIMRVGMVIVAMISSLVIVNIGNIPFLGLIIPNLVSIYRGDSIRKSLFDTAWLGALFVLVCDIIGRLLIFPYEVAIGVIISIVGSVLFLIILFRRNRYATK